MHASADVVSANQLYTSKGSNGKFYGVYILPQFLKMISFTLCIFYHNKNREIKDLRYGQLAERGHELEMNH